MWNLIAKYSQGALFVAIVTSLISAGGSIYAVVLTNRYAVYNSGTQVKLDQISKFDASGEQIVAAYGEMIKLLNSRSDINSAKQIVANVVAQQQISSELLLATFGQSNDAEIRKYQSALGEWVSATKRMSGAGEVGDFIESFGKVLDERKYLSSKLRGRLSSPS